MTDKVTERARMRRRRARARRQDGHLKAPVVPGDPEEIFFEAMPLRVTGLDELEETLPEFGIGEEIRDD